MNKDEKRVVEKKVVRPNQIHILKELLLSHDPKLTKGSKEAYWYEAHKKNCLQRIESIENGWILQKKYIEDIQEALFHMDRQCEVKFDLVEKAPLPEAPQEEKKPEEKPHGSKPIV